MIKHGGPTLVVLALCSVVTLTLIIERAMFYRKAKGNADEIVSKVKQANTISEALAAIEHQLLEPRGVVVVDDFLGLQLHALGEQLHEGRHLGLEHDGADLPVAESSFQCGAACLCHALVLAGEVFHTGDIDLVGVTASGRVDLLDHAIVRKGAVISRE